MYQSSEFNNIGKEEKDRWGMIYNWIFDHQSDIVLVVGIILVALVSFSMGRITAQQNNKEPVIIENQGASILNAGQGSSDALITNDTTAQDTNQFSTSSNNNNQGIIVASKNGAKYHWPWCSFAKKIKPENQIWFKSEAEAQKAGYTACGSFIKLAPAGYKSDLTK